MKYLNLKPTYLVSMEYKAIIICCSSESFAKTQYTKKINSVQNFLHMFTFPEKKTALQRQ